MPARHTLQACCPQGQHQNWSMLQKKKKIIYHYLQKVNIAGKETSIKFSSRGHFACPSTLPDPCSFPTWPYLTDGRFLGLRGYRASLQPTCPTSSTVCPASERGDATNTGTEGKGRVIATQDLVLPAERWGAEQRSSSNEERTHP